MAVLDLGRWSAASPYLDRALDLDDAQREVLLDGLQRSDPVPVVISVINPAAACIANLSARAKSGQIQLTWSHTGAHHYNVYRGTVDGGPYLRIGSTTSTYSTYLDRSVVNGTRYYYVVREVNALGVELCQSNQATARAMRR